MQVSVNCGHEVLLLFGLAVPKNPYNFGVKQGV